MLNLSPKYVVDHRQRRRAVMVTAAEWKRIVEDLEELDDIRAYDAAKAGPQDAVPLALVVRELRASGAAARRP